MDAQTPRHKRSRLNGETKNVVHGDFGRFQSLDERKPSRRKTDKANPVTALQARSAVSNGRRLHVTAPGDTKWSRRFRDIYAQIVSDLGGSDRMSEGQRQLIRRCATLCIECEKLEHYSVLGEPFDVELYGSLTDRLARTLARLGLKRVARSINDPPPNLKSYLRSRKTAELDLDALEEDA